MIYGRKFVGPSSNLSFLTSRGDCEIADFRVIRMFAFVVDASEFVLKASFGYE